ncbi:MAG: DUF3078 domain-containing protein [Flavobacteriaceae bacterium]|nr:DUF3078 domain-containing protein [Flavobacteriaceae bacterium]
MKKAALFYFIFCSLAFKVIAQDGSVDNWENDLPPMIANIAYATAKPQDTIKHWNKEGKFSLLFNQSSFQNWTSGGESNISGTTSVNFKADYTNKNWVWNNQILAAYGLTKINGQDVEKTDDRFEYNSVLGKKAGNYWFYSFFLNFRTQFDKGYENVADSIGLTRKVERSRIFSPAYFTFGPGMLWKKSNNLYLNISPATSKITVVKSIFTETQSAFSVDQGKTTNYELGFNGAAYAKLKIMDNIFAENILNVYVNYLENMQNVDLSYQLNITMQVNKVFSTNLNIHIVYDDDAIGRTQIKQVFGLSVNYDLPI